MSRSVRRICAIVLAVLLGAGIIPAGSSHRPPAGAALPAGFTDQVVFSGLTRPTKVVFAPDGRVFVGQKNGLIKVFNDLSDPTPTVFADLRPQVYDFSDLGLIGLALAPNFPTDPYVYVSYSYDGVIGGSAPTYHDACPTIGSCPSSARVSRLQAAGNVMTGTEQVLLHDWCQQIDSHSVGDLAFGPDGALYVTGGEGASATFVDYGQAGNPPNPCGDPPTRPGTAPTPPTAEGGALRSQDIRTPADPTGLSGTLIRIDPGTGAALRDNPLAGDRDPNVRRILAYGLRNPYRWTFRPGTGEIWLADVGWRTWEEINRVVDPIGGPVRNYGWPCYEGNSVQSGYRSARLALCESLYAAPAGTVTGPYYTYAHSQKVSPDDACPTGGSSPSGVAFYPTVGGRYPAAYRGALFFSDYSRRCVWAMRAGADGLPDPSRIIPFLSGVTPVDLQIGPEGDLYYVDVLRGTVNRVHYASGNQAPRAVVRATPVTGNAPLSVSFDASASSDPDVADILRYSWDFTDDGTVDATGVTAEFTYQTPGTYTARLRVTDQGGLSGTATVRITVGTRAPVPVIETPTTALRWTVGQRVNFSGYALDAAGTRLPASALSWELINRHCYGPDNCHTHPMQTVTGRASGSFQAPDHEYPSHLELTLTATDPGTGLTGATTLRLDPRTVELSLASEPTGLRVNLDGIDYTTPATAEVIVGATVTLSAAGQQSRGGSTYQFVRWSDGGAQTHLLTAPATPTTYTATYSGLHGCADPFGHTCVTTTDRAWIPADDTVLPLTGDDGVTRVELPFPMRFYGQIYRGVWVDVNGLLSFVDPGASHPTNVDLPDPATPNAALYPFWDDLVVRADSTVRTAVTGTAPDRRFVVEWRNIGMYGSTSARISFQAVLSESGQIVFNYADLNTKGRERGDSATIGIENAPGDVALRYSFNEAVLANGRAIVITPPTDPSPEPPPPDPTVGTVTGRVTSAATGAPVAGLTVRLTPGGRTATTARNGIYKFTKVNPGRYTVTATASDGATGQAPVTVVAGQTHPVDLVLAPTPTGVTYTRSVASRPFERIGGDALALTGDDVVTQIALPFAVPFDGRTWSTAWVSSNGFLSFADPEGAQPINTDLPDAAVPNAALYPFWDDLVLRADSSVRTEVVGRGADRRFVVEWRNIGLYGSSSARISFQAIIYESGDIVFNYADLNTSGRERGDSATIGIENTEGSVAVRHSFDEPVLANGTAIMFRPSPR
jgi:glucose/arabinose dehydrogenase/PKD repeat protein